MNWLSILEGPTFYLVYLGFLAGLAIGAIFENHARMQRYRIVREAVQHERACADRRVVNELIAAAVRIDRQSAARRCPYVSGRQRCIYPAGHDEAVGHHFGEIDNLGVL
jgi:hypothetical protein